MVAAHACFIPVSEVGAGRLAWANSETVGKGGRGLWSSVVGSQDAVQFFPHFHTALFNMSLCCVFLGYDRVPFLGLPGLLLLGTASVTLEPQTAPQ